MPEVKEINGAMRRFKTSERESVYIGLTMRDPGCNSIAKLK
jgi:hypothetical protein